jgi:YesN/AraC family two-component response regulator
MITAYPVLTDYFINRPEDFEHCVLLNDAQKQDFIKLFEKMLYYYQNPYIKFCELKIKFTLCEILLAVSEFYSINDETLVIKDPMYKDDLSNIIAYIKNNLPEDLRLDVLANKLYMSKSYIIKIFKQSLEMTPRQYIIYCRIMKSREFLRW